MEKQILNKRRFTGTVVSTAGDKTAVVRVDRTVVHSKYGKRYTRSRRFHVHDENNESRVGEVVDFVESRPISRQKHWRLIKKEASK